MTDTSSTQQLTQQPTQHVDLLVIGSGSGNSLVTPDWEGRTVGIVEDGVFGGTCLNVGCIPTKMFSYAAKVADTVATASRFGVDARLEGVRWGDIRDRVFGRIDPISAGGRDYRINGANTRAYLGRARFVGDRRVRVRLHEDAEATQAAGVSAGTREVEVSADQVVIAAGAYAQIPDVVRDAGVPFHTSDTIMRLETLPRRLLILGGGYIACEFADIFGAFGTQVTIAARGPRLLRHLDGQISERFTALARERWDVRTETVIDSLESVDLEGGGTGIRARLSDGTTCEADALLVAAGRLPNTGDLDCAAGGVEVRADGRVRVDEFGRTSAPGVWALGDVSSPHQLKHVANAEARVIAHNLVHPDHLRAFDHRFVPAAVFTHPQIATVGATREELDAAGTPYRAYTQAYGDVAYGWAMEDTEGFCTVLADPHDGSLLGAHLMGEDASSLIQPLIQAMSFGESALAVARDQYWIHPALAEVVENALLGVTGAE